MRSGLDAYDDDASSPGNENRLDASSGWIRTAYAVPMKLSPGTQYVYCSLNAFLTGAIIENVGGIPLDQCAKAKIYVVPSLHMVVAITSSAYNQHYGQQRSQDILLKILAAVCSK
jgi:hypothetical protein